jgi:2,4-dichlorophenol 6-monooxygenase
MTAAPAAAAERDGFDADVIVVGTGPAGITTALELATLGIPVIALTQHAWLSNTPRAHITNQRAMEVLRDLGLQDDVEERGTPWDQMSETVFAPSLAQPEIARLHAWGTRDALYGDYRAASPCTHLDIPQTELEPILARAAAERGARLRFSTRYLSHEQDPQGVTVHLLDRVTNSRYSLRARYLVGADGARSRIAEEIGLPMMGELARAGTVYARFRADLASYTAHRPGTLYWMMRPGSSFGEIGMMLLRCVRPWTEWIAGWGFDIAQGDPDLSDEHALRQIRAIIGDSRIEPELLDTSAWYVNRQYATSMSAGRVFCAGDATHRHPPSNGLGSNTCIQDAANLAWKLAYVLRGDAGAALLESYSAERVPVGEQVVERANRSRVEYGPLRDLFDTSGEGDPIANGLRRLKEPSGEGVARRERLLAALRLKDYDYSAHGVELNQRYSGTAVIDDESVAVEEFARDPELHAQHTTRPGAKLPHTWLIDAAGRRISTLDLVGHGRMTLVTGLAGRAWEQAVCRLARPYLSCAVIGDPEGQDVYATWAELREITEGGAILVRPDGYIAWRHPETVDDPEEARQALEAALARVLSTPAQTAGAER